MKKSKLSMRILRTGTLLGLLLLVAVLLIGPQSATAATYDYTISGGEVFTVYVGDVLYLYNPESSSGMTFYDYYWSGKLNGGVVHLENFSNRSATVIAAKPGTATVTGGLDGSYRVTNYGQRYNSVTKRWEKYEYYTSRSVNYKRTVTINVIDNIAPAITAQPQGAAAANGKVVSTSVTAEDHSEMTYQWYFKNPGAATFSRSSVTEPTYACKMKPSISGRQVYCVITDSSGNRTQTDVATLSCIDITQQPAGATADPGEKVSATVTATGDGLKYQWYLKDKGSKSFSKSSVRTAKYTYSLKKSSPDRQVYCVITDQYGNSVKTDTVTLKLAVYAAIKTQPQSAVGAMGETVSATVTAVGDGLKYQWYIKAPGAAKFGKSSTTDKTYEITMDESRTGRQAYCVITDQYGTKVKTQTVTFSNLSITQQPANGHGPAGTMVGTTVKAQGEDLTYQWYVKDPDAAEFVKSSVTTAKYRFSMKDQSDGRQVYCVITDKYGNSVQSEIARLRLPVTLTIKKQPQSTYAHEGNRIAATVTVSGTDQLTYQWYVKDPGATEFKKSSVTTARYSCAMKEAISGRQVYCVIEDTYGHKVQTETVTLAVAAPLQIVTQPTEGIALNGNKVSTGVVVTGQGKLTYQWYVKVPGKETFSKSSIKKDTYSVIMSEDIVGREVYCVITDAYGASIQTETVILRNPAELRIDWLYGANIGDKVEMSAWGEGELHYTWYVKYPEDTEFKARTGYDYGNKIGFGSKSMAGTKVFCVVTDDYGQSKTSNIVEIYP